MDDKRFWIGFNLIKGIGAVRMQGLIAYFGELESAWKAAPAELAAAGLGLKVIEKSGRRSKNRESKSSPGKMKPIHNG
jgi:excinuclease UvrABC nuclease subunit